MATNFTYEFNSILPSFYEAGILEFDKITASHEYQDSGKSFNENADTAPRMWTFEFDGLTQAEANLFDAWYYDNREANSFSFTDKLGTVHTTCYILEGSYQESQRGHLSQIQKRAFKIVQYNAVTPDIEAPTVPANLAITSPSATGFEGAFDASTDNVAVTGYILRVNGGAYSNHDLDVGNDITPTVSSLTLVFGVAYTVAVAAYDAAGNQSAFSATESLAVPFDYGAITDIEAWFEAKEETGYSDDDTVTPLTDHSGVSGNGTQGTDSLRALYKTSIINSQPAFRFDGSNDFYTTSITLGTSHTLFFVIKYDGSLGYLMGDFTSGNVKYIGLASAGRIITYDQAGEAFKYSSTPSAPDDPEDFFVTIALVCDGTDTKVYYNKSLLSTMAGVVQTGTYTTLGKGNGALNCDLPFYVAVDREIETTDDDWDDIHAQIEADYGFSF